MSIIAVKRAYFKKSEAALKFTIIFNLDKINMGVSNDY